MCLDHGSFLLIQGEDETTLEQVASILLGDGRLKLVDVFGKTTEVAGTVREIDLMNRRVVLA